MRYLFAIVALLLTTSTYSQSNPAWNTPVHQLNYGNEEGQHTSLHIDQGNRFADLKSESSDIRFFYNKTDRAYITQEL